MAEGRFAGKVGAGDRRGAGHRAGNRGAAGPRGRERPPLRYRRRPGRADRRRASCRGRHCRGDRRRHLPSATTCARAVDRCLERFGRLDILAANAGIADAQPFQEIDEASWRRIIDVNLTGTFFCMQEAARAMIPAGGGAMVATASTNAFWVESGMAALQRLQGRHRGAGEIGRASISAPSASASTPWPRA